jgi:chromosome segregation ATPase
VNRKVVEPLMQIEKDMDRLEEKIQLSQKAVNQLKGDASKLDDNTVKDQSETVDDVNAGVSPRKSFQSLVSVDKQNDNGCKFSMTPSGLSSDVKVIVTFL